MAGLADRAFQIICNKYSGDYETTITQFGRRKRPQNVIVHTDYGGQCYSADYKVLLQWHNHA
ncbi:hypothetical protein GA0061070_10951 [Kosakonia oryziphila]|uniref:Uncharacterized protein n=1 Tax=Kosakonia oryziphila TaxID=1005667 RepID=A0A1C4GNG1_9ENTR|nr:hypothetical protein GA0061070_10951 [Kosakonia oryziphila]